jgi:hypothetical protein
VQSPFRVSSPPHCRIRRAAGDCRCQAGRRRQYRFEIRIARDTRRPHDHPAHGWSSVSPALYKKLRFHPVDSFDFISLVGTFPFVVATRADGPIASLADVIATARQHAGKLPFSSVGFGSPLHLTGELLASSTGGKLTHIPYRGGMQPLRGCPRAPDRSDRGHSFSLTHLNSPT